MPSNRSFIVLPTLFLAISALASAQSLETLVNQPPRGAGLSFLLTDGTVFSQGSNYHDWYKLTPDAFGSYVKAVITTIGTSLRRMLSEATSTEPGRKRPA